MNQRSAKHIVQCEAMLLLTAMKRRMKPSDEKTLPYYNNLLSLKNKLGYTNELTDMKPLEYLEPFLDVISSGEMLGLITGLALAAVDKFISFKYLDILYIKNVQVLQEAMEKIAITVTNTKFVGTDHNSDEVILMKVLKLLDTLMHVPAGCLISDFAVCKIISSCFRICFESTLSELLRHTAECTLENIVHLLFSRLPELKEDTKFRKKNLTINLDLSTANSKSRLRRKQPPSSSIFSDHTLTEESQIDDNEETQNLITEKPELKGETEEEVEETESKTDVQNTNESNKVSESPAHVAILMEENQEETKLSGDGSDHEYQIDDGVPVVIELTRNESNVNLSNEMTSSSTSDIPTKVEKSQYRSEKGIVFKSDLSNEDSLSDSSTPVGSISKYNNNSSNNNNCKCDKVPTKSTASGTTSNKQSSNNVSTSYGLACVQKLLSNLIIILSPENISHTNHVRTGLTLVTAALESGAHSLAQYPNGLLPLIQNELSKHLILLLSSDRLSFFAASARACFLLFEAIRSHLKYQLEMYLNRLMFIIISDNDTVPTEYREVALESVVQLWMMPGFINELYINYDCDLYSSNLLQDLADLFYRITIPNMSDAVSSGSQKSSLSSGMGGSGVSSGGVVSGGSGVGGVPISGSAVSTAAAASTACFYPHMQVLALESLIYLINTINISKELEVSDQCKSINPMLMRKRHLKIGTEKFNKDLKDGLKYLSSHGFCRNSSEIAEFLYENLDVDKRVIGELIGQRKSQDVLNDYIKLFDCRGYRIDKALRNYLEEFRLPGESANIEIIFEALSNIYSDLNPDFIENPNRSYIIIYVIIMLNVSHHNINAKKQQAPMTFEGFKKLLKAEGDEGYYLDDETLTQIYESVKNDEIVLPIEQKGLVKENYLWKRLMRRSTRPSATYRTENLGNRSYELFNLVWKSCVNAFVYVFEVDMDNVISNRVKEGLYQCATIAAYYNLSDIMDKVIIYVSKYTIFPTPQETVEMFGRNEKTQLAAITMFEMSQKHADILRDGWKNLLDCLITLFKAKLLPKQLIEVDDLISKGKITLPIEEQKSIAKTETSSVVNWIFSGLSLSSQDYGSGQRSQADEMLRSEAMSIVERCSIPQLIEDTRFIKSASLSELINALIHGTRTGEEAHIKSLHHRSGFMRQSASSSVLNNNHQHHHHHHQNHSQQQMEVDMNVMQSNNDLISERSLFSSSAPRDEQSRVFCLETLVRVLIHNSDRIVAFRPVVYDHFYTLLIGAVRSDLLLERAVVAALRLTIQLLRKEQDLDQVFTYLEILALTKMSVLRNVNLHIVCGLGDLIQHYAANIPLKKDWKLLLTLLEICGAGTKLNPLDKAEFVSRLQLKDISSLKKMKLDSMEESQNTTLERCHDICNSVEDIPNKVMTELRQYPLSNDESEINYDSRGYTSDSELYKASSLTSLDDTNANSKWILLPVDAKGTNEDEVEQPRADTQPENVILYSEYLPQVNQYNIMLSDVQFDFRDPLAIEKSCEILSYLINDPAHITPTNFEACIRTLRIFAEACVKCPLTQNANSSGVDKNQSELICTEFNQSGMTAPHTARSGSGRRHRHKQSKMSPHHHGAAKTAPVLNQGRMVPIIGVTEDNEIPANISIQLSTLMNTLHCRAMKIYLEWNEGEEIGGDGGDSGSSSNAVLFPDNNNKRSKSETSTQANSELYERLWRNCWCPLLQGMARLGSDVRPHVSTQTINILHNSLSISDMFHLSGAQWEDCFTKVLFPLSTCFLESMKLTGSAGNQQQHYLIETSDPRIRAVQILTKVFLQHLGKLAELSTFTALWLTFLEYMDSYMKSNCNSDSLQDAVRETLKNVLLVMYTGMKDGSIQVKSDVSGQLLKLTCDRLSTFLPELVKEVFNDELVKSEVASELAPVLSATETETTTLAAAATSVEEELTEPNENSEGSIVQPDKQTADDHPNQTESSLATVPLVKDNVETTLTNVTD